MKTKIEKLIKSARSLAKEIDENGIPEDLEDGELEWMLQTLAEYCEEFMHNHSNNGWDSE